MPGFTPEECERCERCGAFIPKVMAIHHMCAGTDLSKRPANIPLALWMDMRMGRFERFDSAFIRKPLQPLKPLEDEELTQPRIRDTLPPPKGHVYFYTGVSFFLGGMITVVLLILLRRL